MEYSPVFEGPLIEQTMLSAGLDYYKPTMSQLAFEQEPDAEATFTFKNRGKQRIADYVDIPDLKARFDQIREYGWSRGELDYLASLTKSTGERMFGDEYLEYLAINKLPEVSVWMDEKKDDIAIETTGKWPLVTFWETVVMSEVSEQYFANYVRRNHIDITNLYQEGDSRIDDWVEYLQANPDVKVAEFGTRRRFSQRWQKHVTERFVNECSDNLVGTSNVALAQALGQKAIGTFAHEMPMAYAALADARGQDVRASHNKMLQDWENKYSPDLLTALSDTFTSDFFFDDFRTGQARRWAGPRQDSGDPLEFTGKTTAFYQDKNIDPTTKTIMYTDGLDLGKLAAIHEAVKDRIIDRYGIGTNWTNNVGIPALNIVMKMTHVKLPDGREADTVKLSDDLGKHTGPERQVRRYAGTIFNVMHQEVRHERHFATV